MIGRDDEVAAVRARLLDPAVRLLTLTGPPGTGKTRLALAVAEMLIDEFAGGVWFVALEAVREPEAVIPAVAQVLGVREVDARPLHAAVHGFLAERRLLLVLDNFEQVLAAASTVAGLLTGCPGLSVLVTSRAPLRLSWERESPVTPLALPDPAHSRSLETVAASPAVALFLQRAEAVDPLFRLTAENAEDLRAICALLDGLPLALELAAARIRLLPPRALRERLDRRLDLLTSGARDLPARHQTLRAALESSYDLLSAPERAVFRRLGIFAGGCTLEAAEAVADLTPPAPLPSQGRGEPVQPRQSSSPPFPRRERGPGGLGPAVLDLLDALVGQSLVQRVQGANGEPRLRLLETVREFALEQLEAHVEREAAARHHAAYFVTLAEAAEEQLTGPEQATWLGRLETEHDNIRAALARALEQGDGEVALRLARAMARFWNMRGHLSEGRRSLDQVLALNADTSIRPRAQALQAAATLAWSQGDYPAARTLAEQSLALQQELGEHQGVAVSLNTLGMVALRQGDLAAARDRFSESLALVRELSDTWRTATALYNLGAVAVEQGDYAAARSFYEESLGLRRGLGNTAGIADSLDALGNLANARGDHAAARALCAEGLALRRGLGDALAIAYSLGNLAAAARAQGDGASARALIEESLSLRRELGDQFGVAWSLLQVGLVAEAQGDHAAARDCWAQSLVLSRGLGFRQGVAACLAALARLC